MGAATVEQLHRMPKIDLQALCCRNGLSTRGDKWDLAERLCGCVREDVALMYGGKRR